MRTDELEDANDKNEDVFDTSFMTVDHNQDDSEYTSEPHERVKEAKKVIGDTENLLDATTPLTPASSLGELSSKKNVDPASKGTTASKSNSNTHTSYEKVKYHDDVGKLVLTDEKIIFKPYDGGAPTRGSYVARTHEDGHDHVQNSHSWRWKAIQKHQISPTTSDKTLLKLVSASSSKKAVIFFMRNRDELNRIRKDVSRRLRYTKKELEERAITTTPIKNGETNGITPTPYNTPAVPTATETNNEATPLLAKDKVRGVTVEEIGAASSSGSKKGWVAFTAVVLLVIGFFIVRYIYLDVVANTVDEAKGYVAQAINKIKGTLPKSFEKAGQRYLKGYGRDTGNSIDESL